MTDQSRVIKNKNFEWESAERKVYKTDTDNFRDIHRYSLLGEAEKDLNFQTRYFEIQPGGYSSLEKHRHPHSVIIIRGKGSVILDNQITGVQLHDVVYISPETIHQFHADKNEALGFICVVDRYRDKPVIPDDETINEQIISKKVRDKIRK
ncbi:MAG TPA: cupin domain-containing protein [Balneolaceae bacterium]|nr:cupin domain-containing protein [Balneolaceae bacterium]